MAMPELRRKRPARTADERSLVTGRADPEVGSDGETQPADGLGRRAEAAWEDDGMHGAPGKLAARRRGPTLHAASTASAERRDRAALRHIGEIDRS